MQKFIICVACLSLLLPTLAMGADGSLSDRVAALENALDQGFWGKVELSGVLEAEANYAKGYDDSKSSDVDLTTVELGIDVTLTDHVSSFVLFKWEDDESKVFVDEGGITLGNVADQGLALTVGKLYLPFGVYATALLTDPLTLSLGETREGAAIVDFASAGFYGAVYAFNSAVDDDSDDMIDAYGAMAGYAFEAEELSADVSFGYISNITSSAGFVDYLESVPAANVENYTAGMAASARIGVADFSLIGEYVAALDSDYLGAETSEPIAWSVEVDYDFEISGHASTLALSYQGSEQADIIGLPESRIAAALSYEIVEGLGAAVEILRNEDYADKTEDILTCQLALEF